MKVLAFAVFDRAARAYSAPFFQHTRGLGERMFADTLMDEKTTIHQHPGDFELFEVGAFDTEEGTFEVRKPELLTTAIQVLSLRKVANDA